MKKYVFSITALVLYSFSLIGQEWSADFKTAQVKAEETNRDIVVVFQGSDWCIPCMKLDREILSHEDFQSYANDHLVMVKADFPRKKKNALTEARQKANAALAERYNPQGIFPMVVKINAGGEVLGQMGVRKSITNGVRQAHRISIDELSSNYRIGLPEWNAISAAHGKAGPQFDGY